MSTLSENISKIKVLSDRHEKTRKRLQLLIEEVKYLSPGILGHSNITPHLSSFTSKSWTRENFYLFDEVKGVNIFLIRLLKDYRKLLAEINNDISNISEELRSALASYDEEDFGFEPMSEYARDMFERDRWNILRPLKDLEDFKNAISIDKPSIDELDSEILSREKLMMVYNSYTLEDLIREQKEVIDSIQKVEI
jgi:hypothetical protein